MNTHPIQIFSYLSFRNSLFRFRNVDTSIWSDSPCCSYNWDNCCVKSDTEYHQNIHIIQMEMFSGRMLSSRMKRGQSLSLSFTDNFQKKINTVISNMFRCRRRIFVVVVLCDKTNAHVSCKGHGQRKENDKIEETELMLEIYLLWFIKVKL